MWYERLPYVDVVGKLSSYNLSKLIVVKVQFMEIFELVGKQIHMELLVLDTQGLQSPARFTWHMLRVVLFL
jgi:hypothetical protein